MAFEGRRHEPETTLPYQVVQEHLETFLRAAGWRGGLRRSGVRASHGREGSPHRSRGIQQFLRDFKSLEGTVADVGPLSGASHARKTIEGAMELYRRRIYSSLGVPSGKHVR
jgi:transposase InsO family protein